MVSRQSNCDQKGTDMVLRKNLPIIEEDESKMKSSIVEHDSDESDEASAVNRH